MSAGVSEERARSLIAALQEHCVAFGVRIACINSPENVTIAGEDHIIDMIHARLKDEGIFTRKLRVPLAYHSRQMDEISQRYGEMMGSLSKPQQSTSPMISCVTGERIATDRLVDPSYWVHNMVSPVLFSKGFSKMCSRSTANLVKKIDKSHVFACGVDHVLEVGPHAVLQAPVQVILRAHQRAGSVKYDSVLRRHQSSMDTMLVAMGNLYSRGVNVNLRAVNECEGYQASSRALLTDLPEYPFDHSRTYWHESRLSRNYRLRSHRPSKLLGVRSRDWNPSDARWRHFIRTVDLPWAEQHHVNGVNLYPAAGMVVMAIEAASQLTRDKIRASGFTLRNVRIDSPMNLSEGSLEVQTSLRESPGGAEGTSFEFTIRSFANDRWTLNCQGSISVESSAADASWSESKAQNQLHTIARNTSELYKNCDARVDSDAMYTYLSEHGLEYGSMFQIARQQRHDKFGRASAAITRLLLRDEDEIETEAECIIHPVTLDAILHLCFTAFTAGGSRPMATSVPSRIGCLWVANRELADSEQKTVAARTNVTSVGRRGFSCDGIGLDGANSGAVWLWYEGLELTNLSSVPKSPSLPNPRQFCMNVDCKVSTDMLNSSEIRSLLLSLHPARGESPRRLFEDLGQLIAMALEDLVSSVDPSTLNPNEPWREHYWRWANHHHHLNRGQHGYIGTNGFTEGTAESAFDKLCSRLEDVNHVSRLYVTVARNLIALWKAEVTPLELLMESGLLKDYYKEVANYTCAIQISAYMDLLVHQRPGLKMLEVGGGTGAGTRNLIRTLCAQPGRPGSQLRCDRYDFTDVSSAFLNHAKEEFEPFTSQMTFGTLNIEHDFSAQGYHEGGYDVVIASSVLHITHDLKQTLQNVRKVLKPGGKLVIQESFQPDGWTLGFVFGVFPGWWVGSNDDRPLSPSITIEDWDLILKGAGFSGADLVLRDFEDDVAHTYGWLVSTVVADMPEQTASVEWGFDVTIAVDTSSERQQLLATELTTHLQDACGLKVRLLSATATAIQHEDRAGCILLWLADYGPSYLASTTPTTWETLRVLPRNYTHWLWVTAGGGEDPSPEHGMVDGLARTLRQEYPGLHLVTVALDGQGCRVKSVGLLLKVLHEMKSWLPAASYEQEYIEMRGLLHTRRLVEANYLKAQMDAKIVPYHTNVGPFHAQIPFKISSMTDTAHSPHYVPLPPETAPAKGDLVDVAVKAIILRSQGRSLTRDEEEHQINGNAYAGVVLQAGSESSFQPGDRVFAVHRDAVRSQIRTTSKSMVRIPSQVTYADACRLIPPRLIAYTALVDTARVQSCHSVLIHNGGSLSGRAALHLAAAKGVVDLWATAADEDESMLITRECGLGPERILPSSWFESNQMLLSPWKQFFDVVVSLDGGEVGSLITQCVKPGGHYVWRRSTPIASSNVQHAHDTPSKMLVSLLPDDDLTQEVPVLSHGSLQYGSAIACSQSPPCSSQGCTEFLGSEVEAATESLWSERGKVPVILKFEDSDIIKVNISTDLFKCEINTRHTDILLGQRDCAVSTEPQTEERCHISHLWGSRGTRSGHCPVASQPWRSLFDYVVAFGRSNR